MVNISPRLTTKYDKATQMMTDASTLNVLASSGNEIKTIVSMVERKVDRPTATKTSHL
tara:strand:- start:12541 stop:12714 length:174 start_codon:yes stop_codon:yes gene_type:complete